MDLMLEDPVLLLFNHSVLRYPQQVAVEDGPLQSLTYKQLDEESTILREHLSDIGVQPGDIIPIITTSCIQMVIGILGILKAGAAYVPVDREQCSPLQIEYIMQSSKAKLVLYTGIELTTRGRKSILLPLSRPAPNGDKIQLRCSRKNDVMAIVFTSGTTSKPKGVKIRSSSVARFVCSPQFNYDITAKDRVLLVLSVGFDACLGTLFNTLCNGGTVVLATSRSLQKRARECTVIVATPSIMTAMGEPAIAEYPHLSRIVLGGETPSQMLLNSWANLQVPMWIAYGPTEATCAVLTGQLRRDVTSRLFHPTHFETSIPGSNIILLDSQLQEVHEFHQQGEICISGPCLSAGYLNDDACAKAAERFFQFKGRLTYRTGDLAQWTRKVNGSRILQFCGREDRVTKVRGFLVNLEQDVDHGILRACPSVRAIFSLLVNERLCTAIVGREADPNNVLTTWRKIATPYTVPDHVVLLEALPLTSNGKVDPRELSAILKSHLHAVRPSLGPSPGLEDVIFAWVGDEMQLGPEQIDVTISCVALGMHSLGAVKLSAFCRQFGYAVSAADILAESPLADLISRCRESRCLPMVPESQRPLVTQSPLSTLQQKLALETKLHPDLNYVQHLSHYHTRDIARIKSAWQSVVREEPLFRTVFRETEHQHTMQEVLPTARLYWDEAVIASTQEVEQKLSTARSQTGLGSRFLALQLDGPDRPDSQTLLVWTTHRALLDGFSASLLFNKVDKALRGLSFLPSIEYTQVATDLHQLRESLKSEAIKLWDQQEKRFPESKGDFLIPKPTPSDVATTEEWTVGRVINIDGLKQCAQRANVTSASVLHAAWALVVSTYTNFDEVLFGIVLSGRDLPFPWALSAVGPLINQLPFRCGFERHAPVREFLQSIHRDLQSYSKFQINDGYSRMGALMTTLVVEDAGLQAAPVTIPLLKAPTTKDFTSVPLVVDFKSSGEVRLIYRTDHFARMVVRDVGDVFVNIVEALIATPDGTVQDCLDHRLPLDMKRAFGAVLVLSPNYTHNQHNFPGSPRVIVTEEILQRNVQRATGPWRPQKPNDVAYVCFTSGSTGVPKAVICLHRGMVALQSTEETRLYSGPGRRIAQFLAPGFGGCIHEVFSTLCYGGTLVLRKDDSDMLSHLNDVDSALITPSVAAEMDSSQFPNIHFVYFAGEPVTEPTVRRWGAPGRRIYNIYGSTEVTAINCQGPLHPDRPICLGGPIPTSRLYILDDRLKLLPSNTIGNIFVAGTQVSNGYINLPDQTNQEFFDDPFVGPNEKMYRMGDLGFWDHEAKLHYVSRKDRQLKIHGFRVNLDEIPPVVYAKLPAIRKAVAVVQPSGIALFVSPSDVDKDMLKRVLRTGLPPHYQPSRIHTLDEIPLTKNGKIDMKALAAVPSMAHTAPETKTHGDLATSATEETVGGVWKQLLHLEPKQRLSRSDDFFNLGGDSVAMLKLVRRLNSIFNIRISLQDLIRRPRLQDLASIVDYQQKIEQGNPPQQQDDPQCLGLTELSPPELLWVHFYTHSEVQSSFNVPWHAHLSPSVNLTRLASVLEAVLNRHRIFRSRFSRRPGHLYKREISDEPIAVRWEKTINVRDWVSRPFRLDESLFTDLYTGKRPEPARIQREYFNETMWNTPIEAGLSAFWATYFNGLSFSRRPEGQKARSHRGTSVVIPFPGSVYRQLVAKISSGHFTFQQYGLSVTAMLLQVLAGTKDIILGTAHLNHSYPENECPIGLYQEALPIRIILDDDMATCVADIIRTVATSSQSALAHAMPWHSLLSQLNIPFPSGYDEVFDCAVTFHDRHDPERTPSRIDGITPTHFWAEGAKFILLFEWHFTENGLSLRVEYDTDRVSESYLRVLKKLLLVGTESMLNTEMNSVELKKYLRLSLQNACYEVSLDVEVVNELARKHLVGAVHG
ncbi:hypothetical protein FE257_003911 [Aspergillus nanangensis]|uniref:Carrier domain-containing protein n=1 Tax=Aspergillus nanangensis TaxID=2582783 RepID=A0AAD4GW92_ASPNN|nr:hypothetical protein FE257_003911 [Aspergillus nanangensis]